MRRSLILIVAAATLAAATSRAAPVLQGPPPRELTAPKTITSPAMPGASPVPISDLFYVRDGRDAVWTPDGRSVVFSTNLTGRYNLWKAPAGGGFPLQLTVSDEEQKGLATSPDGKWLVFQSDHAGNEIYDLFAVSLDRGDVTNLTSSPGVAEEGARFSRGGEAIAFNRRIEGSPSADVAVMDFRTHGIHLLTHETDPKESWSAVAFVNGDRELIANRILAGRVTGAVWRIDVATGAATQLAKGGPAHIVATDATANGRYVAVTIEQADGSRQAALLETATGRLTPLQRDPWEQKSGHFSRDGGRLVFTRNVDGRAELSIYSLVTGRVSPVPMPEGVNEEGSSGQGLYINPDGQSSFSPDGRRLLVAHQSSTTSMDYWSVDLQRGTSKPITALGLASVAARPSPGSQVVHYLSEDGTVISALLWTPFNLRRDGSAPALVAPHGGPAHQIMDNFNRQAVALASRGYVVISPNFRGSSGYGRAFESANFKDLGGGDLQDVVAAADFLVQTGYVDRKKIGVIGASYGGYLTLIAAAKRPDLWAAAVEQFGIVDWSQIYRTAGPPLRQYVATLLGTPEQEPAAYSSANPITFIHDLKAPLLVLQGDNDIRVPKSQAETLVEALKRDGRTVAVHYYPNEGHGFVKRENQIDALERVVEWLDAHLKAAR